MKDTVKRSILAGIGLVDLSIDMARHAIESLVKSGEMTAEQGKKALEKLRERGERGADDLSKKIDEATSRALEGMNIVTMSKFEALELRVSTVESLDRRVAELERIVDEITNREAPGV